MKQKTRNWLIAGVIVWFTLTLVIPVTYYFVFLRPKITQPSEEETVNDTLKSTFSCEKEVEEIKLKQSKAVSINQVQHTVDYIVWRAKTYSNLK